MTPDVRALLDQQSGVVARRQLLEHGLAAHDVARMRRRRELVLVHPGVYVEHTGEPTWRQRAWAAVLALWPAALYGESALLAADGPGQRAEPGVLVHVAIDRTRCAPAPLEGVRVHHVVRLAASALWNTSPPRRRYEEAALDVAADAEDELVAVAALAKVCGSRLTTAGRLRAALDARPRVRRRDWLDQVLRDVENGACSALEHGFLSRVERPHGLPRARRQRPVAGRQGLTYRDAWYGEQAALELDGRLWHDTAVQRDTDMDRDLDAAAQGAHTVRLGSGQVYRRQCLTAVRVAQWLSLQGVEVRAHACSPLCPVGA